MCSVKPAIQPAGAPRLDAEISKAGMAYDARALDQLLSFAPSELAKPTLFDADFALSDNTAFMLMDKFDGIFDRDDMPG